MKTTIYYTLIVGFLCILFGTLKAQDSSQCPKEISGKLTGNEAMGLEGATIAVYRKGDSLVLKNAISNHTGFFKICLQELVALRLRITFTGYETYETDVEPGTLPLDLGTLKLNQQMEATLEGAVVVATRPQFETREDTLIMNVSSMPMAAGSSGADLLRNMPMVNTDPEGRLLVKGKQPIVLIDDKPVDMQGQQLSDLLESLPGNAIERIELMQNPPPQFAGSEGGVINIVTKKGAIGWTGRISMTVGTIGQTQGNLNLSYRSKKLTFMAVASGLTSRLDGTNYSRRENRFKDSTNWFHTDAGFSNQYTRPNVRIETNYDVNKSNQWSFVLQANANDYLNQSLTTFTSINRFEDIWKQSLRSNHTEGFNISFQPQVGYTWYGTNRAEKFQLNASYNTGTSDNDRLFLEEFLKPVSASGGIDSSQVQQNRNKQGNGSLRLNYQKPLRNKNYTFTTGASLNFNHSENVLNTFFIEKGTGNNEPNALLSTNVQFRQQVVSARAGMSARWNKKWRVNANLQWEGTHFDFKFIGKQEQTNNDYHNLLPSINIQREIKKDLRAALVYRKTIRRPGMSELNPAIDYSDPYNLRFGNPALSPSQAHNFDLNLNWNKGKSYINGSVGFNRVQDIVNRIRTLMPDGKTWATFRNVANRNEYEAGVWSGYSFSQAFRLNLSALYVFHQYGDKEKEELKFQDGNTVTLNLNGSYMLSPVLSFDGSLRYNAFADPQGRSRSNVSTQMGVQYKLLQRKLILAAAAIDPFTRQEIYSVTNGPNFTSENFRAAITRNYRLTVAWVLQARQKKA